MKYYEIHIEERGSNFITVRRYKSVELAVEDVLKTVRERIKYLYGNYYDAYVRIVSRGEWHNDFEFSTIEDLEKSYREDFKEKSICFYKDSWLYGLYMSEKYSIKIKETGFEDD